MTIGMKQALENVTIGPVQYYKNMIVYSILSSHQPPVAYLMLDQALDQNVLLISEVSEGGSVPELKVKNLSESHVLLLDGEELVGAKQNRVLNVTVLVSGKSETIIPVSCVEQGRWTYRDRNFGSESRTMSARQRKKKSETVAFSLAHYGSFASDQHSVWEEISEKYRRMQVNPSPTMAMADLYDSVKSSSADYEKHFRCAENQIGILVFIDGKLTGMELLYNFKAFAQTHGKLINSYVMDALETQNAETLPDESTKRKAGNFIQAIESAEMKVNKSVALGNDIRMESPVLSGAALEFENYIIHGSFFPKNGETAYKGRRMQRASGRRNHL